MPAIIVKKVIIFKNMIFVAIRFTCQAVIEFLTSVQEHVSSEDTKFPCMISIA